MSDFQLPNRYTITMKPKTQRMKYLHFNTPGTPHGLTFSCFKNRNFLNYKRTRIYLVNSLENSRRKHNFDIWAYVIMPDHVHLLVFPKNADYSISKILKSIKLPVAKHTLQWIRVNKPENLRLFATGEKHHPYRFWKDGGGYDRNIRDQNELNRFVNYVHDNPVRRGLVEQSIQWYWSSASEWLCDIKGPVGIDRESFPVL